MLDKLLFNWCHPYPTAYHFIPNHLFSCVATHPTYHTHLCDMHLLDVFPLSVPPFCFTKNGRSDCRPRIPDACCHFIHPVLILWLTSSSLSALLCNIDPICLKMSLLIRHYLPPILNLSSTHLTPLNSHHVFVLLRLNPLYSKVYLHNSSFLSTPTLLSSTSIASST